MKKYLPWAAIVVLLIGLALLPGPKAGAAVAPPTASLTSSVGCNNTTGQLTVTFTEATANAAGLTATNTLFYLFPTGTGVVLAGYPNTLVGDQSYTFTMTLPAAGFYHLDTVVRFPGFDPGGIDLSSAGTAGTCTVTTTTTTVPAPPVGTPPAPPAPTPPVVPATPPATVQAPLAFTGSPVLPEIAVALVLILAGLLLVRKTRVA